MSSITITGLNNAKTDVDHIAEIATSRAITATDRKGNVKDTIAGAVAKIAAFNSRGVWGAATAYAVKDLVSNAGTWYVAVVAHTSSAAFATDAAGKWRVYQGVTLGDLAAIGGASLVGVRSGQTLGDIFQNFYVATNYDDIEKILTDTSGPVCIYLAAKRFKAPLKSLTYKRDGIALIGMMSPRNSQDNTRMENGSIVEGTLFFQGCNSGVLCDIGVDRGLYVTNNLFAGVRSDGLVVTSIVDGDISQSREINGWVISNVSGLVPVNTEQNPSKGHAILIEGVNGISSKVGDLSGDGGSSAVAIKCKNMKIGNVKGVRGFPYNIVLKSNTYANFNDIQTGILTSRDGGGIAIVADDETVGYGLARLEIEGYFATNCQWGLRTDSASGQPISDVHIGFAFGRGITGTGLHIKGANTSRITVDNHSFEGCQTGVIVNEGATGVDIGTGNVVGSKANGYFIDSDSVISGHIKSTYNTGCGIVTYSPNFCCDSFNGNNNTGGNYGGPYVPCPIAASEFFFAFLSVGMLSPSPITLSIGAKFIFSFVNGDISRSGGGAINSGTELCTIPSAIRPISSKFIMVGVLLVGGSFDVQPATISNVDGVVTYRGQPAATIYLGGNSFDRR